MFWRRRKPLPWYKKLWSEWKQFLTGFVTLCGLAASGYGYLAVDTSAFEATTDIITVADHENVYIEIIVQSMINENTYIITNIDDQQAKVQVYPKGIPEGRRLVVAPISYEGGEELRVNVEIVIKGMRTLFQPITLEVTNYVERPVNPTTSFTPAVLRYGTELHEDRGQDVLRGPEGRSYRRRGSQNLRSS